MSGPTVVTLDIGGTTIKGALVGADGRELTRLDRDTGAAAGADEVVARVRATCAGAIEHCAMLEENRRVVTAQRTT